MNAASGFVLTLLANAVWQAPVVAALAFACTAVARRAPARHRYLVWVAALMLSTLLPVAIALRATVAPAASASQAKAAEVTGRAGPAGGVDAWLRGGASEERAVPVAPAAARVVMFVYAGFIAYGVVRFARAWRRASALRTSAVACRVPEAVDSVAERCARELGVARTPILVSWTLTVPATVGVLRPIVLLPAALLAEDDPNLLATAVGHELAHVRRRDFAAHLACELLAIPLAFHPAVAYVRRKIREARERACDERVTERILESRAYARSLVEIARLAPPPAPVGHSLGVFDADTLEDRVMHLVGKGPKASSYAGHVLLLVALAVFGVAAAAASSHAVVVSAATQAPERGLVGQWSLYIWNDAESKSDEGENGLPALLAIDFDGAKLSGTATVWPVRHTENGRIVGDDAKKVVFPLVDPKFDGTTFVFKVFNGEESLVGELKLDGAALEGRWVSSKSNQAGRLRMVRRS